MTEVKVSPTVVSVELAEAWARFCVHCWTSEPYGQTNNYLPLREYLIDEIKRMTGKDGTGDVDAFLHAQAGPPTSITAVIAWLKETIARLRTA